MPRYRDERFLNYSPQQLYDLVVDVEAYPDFLPWCIDSRITKHISDHEFHAVVTAGYLFARESFTSRVCFNGSSHITAEYIEGPFRHLKNEWHFFEHEKGTHLKFFVDFEFTQGILNRLANHFLIEVTQRMVDSFTRRALEVYGK